MGALLALEMTSLCYFFAFSRIRILGKGIAVIHY